MYNSSLKYAILQRVKGKYPDRLAGIEAEEYAMKNGFKSSNASRRLRELCREGLIERIMINGHVEYLWKLPIQLPREEEVRRLVLGLPLQ